MTLEAIILRADGAFAEIEEVRRQAFVAAFREAGFNWEIERQDYSSACRLGGTADRMAYFVQQHLKGTCDATDAKRLTEALNRKALKVLSDLIASGALEPREGVREIIVAAHQEGMRLGLVSTMPRRDVEAMLVQALGGRGAELFDAICVMEENDDVGAEPERLYRKLKSEFDLDPERCLVIESTLAGMVAAKSVRYPAICTRSAYCMDSAGGIDSVGYFEDLPSVLARSSDRRGEPLSKEERDDLLSAFQKLACGNFSTHPASTGGQTMRVRDILQVKGSAVKTVEPSSTIRAFARALRSEGVGAMVVMEKSGRLCGIITERDLAKGLADYGDELVGMPVSALMTKGVVTCAPEDSLASVAKVMTQRRIRHLPVVVGSTLSGLVSIGDVLKYRLDEVQLEASVLREVARARR